MNISYPDMARATIHTVKSVGDSHLVRETAAHIVGGFTITDGVGGWTNGDGAVVTEPAAIITLLHPDVSLLRRACDSIAHYAIRVLGESEVWITIDRDVRMVKYSATGPAGPAF